MRRGLAGLFLSLLGLSVVSALQASPTPEREVHVYEKTLSPYTTYDYNLCDTSDLRDALNTSAMLDCKEKTTFVWEGDSLPTLAQRKALCNCTDVMDDLELSYIPRCAVFKDKMTISLAVFISYSFGVCDYTTTVSRPQESTPSPTKEEESASSAPMVIGIVGGVLVCIIIAAFMICRKKRQPETSGAVPTKGDPEQSEDDDYIVHATPLSPMTGYPTSDYISVVASPKTERTNDTSTTNNSSSNSRASSRNSSQQNVNSSVGRPTIADNRADTGSRSSSDGRNSSGPSSQHSARSVTRPAPTPKLAMWDDPVIMAVRVPLDTVFFGPLVAQGGFGEVYKGTYRGETVAIKQLLPARRKDLAQIDSFLSEIKLMASLDHERIVKFIGVAWNSLSEVCAVTEYMENGDLRSVISRWDAEEQRPLGFDADKIKIALHIAHALTYLHSLQPVVVHRDLKSKNILLTNTYDAKLTDFGVSRERADSTMTAGVGSSLWMAPEVMMGERYNEKADVFSYGVVLSELDTQQLPYADAKAAAPDQRLPDSAILQMVSLGRLRISFSEHANQGLVELAYDCVQVEPEKRPTIAEVLYRVHQASRRD